MTIYFYGRCSAEENYDKGSSIETQISKSKSYANIHDLTIDEFITEQVSGSVKMKDRDKGNYLLQKLEKGDEVISSALCRFSRNHLDLLTIVEDFKKQKIKLHFVDIGSEITGDDVMGNVFVKLLSVFSEFYSKQMSEKQKNTKERMFHQMKYRGGKKPYGYDVDDNGGLVKCEKEQSVIRLMRFLRKQGKTFREISNQITNSTRKKFPVSWVFDILKREEKLVEVAV